MHKLHLISQQINLTMLQNNMQRFVQQDDHLLFIADACIGLTNQQVADYLQQSNVAVSALVADCEVRGITAMIEKNFSLINDAQMVDLTLEHNSIISW